ncbi:DUF6894 family protein [Bradyrhizobium guangdongense]|uniref:DUF6894 family protein n=1 Tax=Bradyrhizobium guangdongense TaxID=1325090 RepID=UPI003D9A9979
MSRYYFDIQNGHPYRDEVGQDLQDDHEAWRQAVRLTRDVEDRLAPGGTWRLEVKRDETTVFRLEVRSEITEDSPLQPEASTRRPGR